jgi:hypothetical protein
MKSLYHEKYKSGDITQSINMSIVVVFFSVVGKTANWKKDYCSQGCICEKKNVRETRMDPRHKKNKRQGQRRNNYILSNKLIN